MFDNARVFVCFCQGEPPAIVGVPDWYLSRPFFLSHVRMRSPGSLLPSGEFGCRMSAEEPARYSPAVASRTPCRGIIISRGSRPGGPFFRSLAHLNEVTAWWLVNVADVRVQGTTGATPRQIHAEELPRLLPLRACDFQADRVSVSSVGGTNVDARRVTADLTTPKGLPLVGFTAEKCAEVAHRIGAVLAPTHAGLLEALAHHRFTGRFDSAGADHPTVRHVLRIIHAV